MIYVSDLDGTLLNRDGTLSVYTRDTLLRLIKEGVKITVATARSARSARHILEELGLVLPVILRNGAVIYDPVGQKNLVLRTLGCKKAETMLQRMMEAGRNPIVHAVYRDRETVDYIRLCNSGEEAYIASRKARNDPRIRQVTSFDYPPSCRFLALCCVDKDPIQRDVYQKIFKDLPAGLLVHLYREHGSDMTWMEVNHRKATKGEGMKIVLSLTGESEYIAFGDSENDLDLLACARGGYIPEGSNLHRDGWDFPVISAVDGVARTLEAMIPML